MRRTIQEDAAGLFVVVARERQYVRAFPASRFAAGDRVQVQRVTGGRWSAAARPHLSAYLVQGVDGDSNGQADPRLSAQVTC